MTKVILCGFGNNQDYCNHHETHCYDDFDAFAESVQHVDSRMLLRHLKKCTWSISSVNLNGTNIQFGRLSSGNIAQGELQMDGYMLYLPLTDAVEYAEMELF